MDPLSVAGSIAGLVSLGQTVFLGLYHFTRSVKNADKEIVALKHEVEALNGILTSLKLIAEELEADDTFKNPRRLQHVSACLLTLDRLKTKLDGVNLSGKSKMRKLTWPYKSKETTEHRRDPSAPR